MSRSNPTDNTPNPATRWFEWDGSAGNVRYYDKVKKENVVMPEKFTFMLLDQLATVKGWHDASESGIFANEVKDTRAEPLVVKAFHGGTIAEGFYKAIRDKVVAAGGHFVANCYIAYRDDNDEMQIGSIQFKGAALSAWMEFAKDNRGDLYKQAIRITGTKEGKKGNIKFQTPTFALHPISEEANESATELDRQLQEYLKSYFSRTRVEQATPPPTNGHSEEPSEPPPAGDDDEIPF